MVNKVMIVDLDTFRSGNEIAIKQKSVLLEALADEKKVIKDIKIQGMNLIIEYDTGSSTDCSSSLCNSIIVNKTDTGGQGLSLNYYKADGSGLLPSSTATGTSSFVSGTDCHSTGDYSIAIGSNCNVNDLYSTCIGKGCNIPVGEHSFAIGRDCIIEKGSFCTAIGNNCIIKGYNNGADGHSLDCFTAGYQNKISGQGVTCLGFDNTIESCDSAFVAGQGNRAGSTGKHYSVALGYSCNSNGTASVAMGENCNATYKGSFAMGIRCDSEGAGSIAMGYKCKALKDYSVSIGTNNSAQAHASFAAGEGCITSGKNSSAIGDSCNAKGDYSIAMGTASTATSHGNISIGIECNSGGPKGTNYFGCTAIGDQNTAFGEGSTSMGISNTTNNRGEFACGYNNIGGAGGTSSKAGYISNQMFSVGIGTNLINKGINLFSLGYGDKDQPTKHLDISNKTDFMSGSTYMSMLHEGESYLVVPFFKGDSPSINDTGTVEWRYIQMNSLKG